MLFQEIKINDIKVSQKLAPLLDQPRSKLITIWNLGKIGTLGIPFAYNCVLFFISTGVKKKRQGMYICLKKHYL